MKHYTRKHATASSSHSNSFESESSHRELARDYRRVVCIITPLSFFAYSPGVSARIERDLSPCHTRHNARRIFLLVISDDTSLQRASGLETVFSSSAFANMRDEHPTVAPTRLVIAGEREDGFPSLSSHRRPRRASSFVLSKRPSARRGPGIVSVDRNVRSKCRCSCVLQFTS